MISKRLKVLSLITLSVLALFGMARVYYAVTDDFRLSNITHDLSQEKGWAIPRLSPEQEKKVKSILSQPFTYIGKGAQCYAFESEDGQYVLKFFKFKHLRPTWFVRMLPSIFPFENIKKEAAERKRKKLHSVFDGYELAYKENQKESELLYLHLQPTDYLDQSVTVYDKIGFQRVIPLDDVVFLLQRKGETLRTRLNAELGVGDIEAAKHSITQILEMYIREYQKGLYDRDHGVTHNTGFVDGHAFHLDVGKFTKDESMRQIEVYQKDLKHIAWKIDVWVKRTHPQYYSEITAFLSDKFKLYTGATFDGATIDPMQYKKRKH